MSWENVPISETIAAGVAALVAWVTGGKYAAKSAKIDSTAKLIELWEKANHNCQSELDELRGEIKEMRQRYEDTIARLEQKIKVMSEHIKKLEAK